MIVENLNQTPASPIAIALALVPFGVVAGVEIYLHWRYPQTYLGGFVWRRVPRDEPSPEVMGESGQLSSTGSPLE
jgi:hypothetical protein